MSGIVRGKALEFEQVGPGRWEAACSFGKFRITEYPRGMFSVYQGQEQVGTSPSLERAERLGQLYFERLWRESTEVPELEFEDAGCGYWYASHRRYCVSRVDDEFDAWLVEGPSPTRFGRFPSIEGARGACNAHNRRAVLGE